MKKLLVVSVVLLVAIFAHSEYKGQYSVNPYAPNSTANEYGTYGNPYGDTVTNPYSQDGHNATSPYSYDAPKLYDSDGNYRGKLSNNQYDPDSISNPYGRYGSPYSPDSVNNPYGAGSPYRYDSPNNPYGEGWSIYSE